MLHLELTNDMSMDEFLHAFHRMFNHRGLCNTVWSDNAQTFKAASHEIKQLFGASLGDSVKVWKKIDESKSSLNLLQRASNGSLTLNIYHEEGGWWEKFCRSVKGPLRKVLGKAHLTYTELYNVLTDIEAVITLVP